MPKYLVTGGCGFIGSALVSTLVSQGAEVTVIDDLSRPSTMDVPNEVTFIRGDVSSPETWLMLDTRFDGVFHLAARLGNSASIEDPISDARVNILGTINVLEWMIRGHCRKLVVTNSICSWQEADPEKHFTEEEGVVPESPYGLSKLVCGEYALMYKRMYPDRIDVSVPKLFNVYGPGDRIHKDSNVIPVWVRAALRNESLTVTGPDGVRDYVYVGDVVDILIKAMQRPCNQMFNVGTGIGTRTIDLAKTIIEIVGSGSCEIRPPRPWDRNNVRVADVRRLRELYGLPRVPIRVGLERTVEWAKKALI